jgi:hypothetical protein
MIGIRSSSNHSSSLNHFQNVPSSAAFASLSACEFQPRGTFQKRALDTQVVEPVAERFELLNKILIDEWKTFRVHVTVVAPLLDPGGHAIDHVSRVGLDDNLVDVTLVSEAAVDEHVSDFVQSIDRGPQLSTLASRTSLVELEGVVVH